MLSKISINGKPVRGSAPVSVNSVKLYDKKVTYCPKSYSIFDVIEPSDNPQIFEEIFAWVEDDTLYLRGSSVSVINNELVMTTAKARVEGDTLYLVR